MKRLSIIFLSFAILSSIIAFNLFIKEQDILNINDRNIESFKMAIGTDKIRIVDNFGKNTGAYIDVNSIKKVKVGSGWHSNDLTIYYSNGKLDGRWRVGPEVSYDSLRLYVIDNGYSADKVGLIYIYISIFCFIVFAILKKSTRKN